MKDSNKPTTNPTKVTTLKEGAVSAYTACRECGKRFTQRNTTFMAYNLMHMAKMLKDAGGIPAEGNVRSEWDDGCKPGWPNPEFRLDD